MASILKTKSRILYRGAIACSYNLIEDTHRKGKNHWRRPQHFRIKAVCCNRKYMCEHSYLDMKFIILWRYSSTDNILLHWVCSDGRSTNHVPRRSPSAKHHYDSSTFTIADLQLQQYMYIYPLRQPPFHIELCLQSLTLLLRRTKHTLITCFEIPPILVSLPRHLHTLQSILTMCFKMTCPECSKSRPLLYCCVCSSLLIHWHHYNAPLRICHQI